MENEQNVRNRMWEVTYTSHIQQYVGSFCLLTADDGKVGRAQAEEEAWKKVSYGYEAYMKQLQGSLEARSADLLQGDSSGSGMSAKAKGKRRTTGNVDLKSTNYALHLKPHSHLLNLCWGCTIPPERMEKAVEA